jgi:Raf kinase inhibitor-like YbhB/YbcL family protein
MENTVYGHLLLERELRHVDVHSTAFANMGAIPVQFTADGDGISPPLEWHGIPDDASCVVLIVEDADSATPHPWVHAIAVTAGGDGSLASGALPSEDHDGAGVHTGLNSHLQHRWLPPAPPPGHGAHRYVFQMFALGEGAALSQAPGRTEVWEAVRSHAIAAGALVGTYERLRRQSIEESEQETDLAPAGVMTATA